MPKLVHYNQFCPRNIKKANECTEELARIDMGRLKYVNEKSL